ncbi:hypothetical protein ACFE04_012234 [Oxalis oulophora]
MESANLQQQQHELQEKINNVESSSSLAWTPNNSLNYNEDIFHSSSRQIKSNDLPIHDLNWQNQSAHDLHLAKIKHEISLSSPQNEKFTEMLNSPLSIEDLSSKLLLKTISSGFPINTTHHFHPNSTPHFFSNISNFGIPSRGNYSQIYPSVHISSSYEMNLQATDPPRCNFGLNHMQPSSNNGQSCNPNMLSPSFDNEEPDQTKRTINRMTKETQSAHKKTRTETRSSCPPFKRDLNPELTLIGISVRKEKLGDRIAALQQLVAPFGKTDTASVLMEAIGYIKFLQQQVETLSVPYMKNKNRKTMQRGSEEWDEEPKRDLRSRGLCLVPLSCMSYVTNDGGGTGSGIWPPPNFEGGT